jgi:hypothetical protein
MSNQLGTAQHDAANQAYEMCEWQPLDDVSRRARHAIDWTHGAGRPRIASQIDAFPFKRANHVERFITLTT